MNWLDPATLVAADASWLAQADGVPFQLATFSIDGQLTYLNRRSTDPPVETTRRHLSELLPPTDAPRFLETVRHVARTGEPAELELATQIAGISSRCYRVYFSPLRQQGKIIAVMTVSADITDSRQAEAELRMSVNALQRLAEERAQLSRDLHDGILQSLYAVGLGLEAARAALRTGAQDSESWIDRSIGQLNETMRMIRRFISEGGSSFPPEVALEEAWSGIIRGMEAPGGPSIELAIERETLRALPASAQGELLAVAREAVANAVRHAGARRITVRLERSEGVVRLDVEDDGTGYAPDPQHRGFGILNMMQRAAKVDGEISIHTTPGAGTLIRLELAAPTEGSHG